MVGQGGRWGERGGRGRREREKRERKRERVRERKERRLQGGRSEGGAAHFPISQPGPKGLPLPQQFSSSEPKPWWGTKS